MSQQPMRTYISVEQVILETLMGLQRDDLKESPIIHKWAEDAEKKIAGKYQYEYVNRVLKVDKCKAKLPAGVDKIMALVLGDKGEECDVVFNYLCGVNVTFDLTSQDIGGTVVIPGSTSRISFPVQYFVQDGHIVFDKDMDNDYITVRLQVFKTDDRGFIKVQESHLEAVKYYIMFKMSEGGFKMPQVVNYYRQLWNQECRNARAASSEGSLSDREQAAALYNNPYSGRAVEIY